MKVPEFSLPLAASRRSHGLKNMDPVEEEVDPDSAWEGYHVFYVEALDESNAEQIAQKRYREVIAIEVSKFNWMTSVDLRFWMFPDKTVIARAYGKDAESFTDTENVYEELHQWNSICAMGFTIRRCEGPRLTVAEHLAMKLHVLLDEDSSCNGLIEYGLILANDSAVLLVVRMEQDDIGEDWTCPATYTANGVPYIVIGEIDSGEPVFHVPKADLLRYLAEPQLNYRLCDLPAQRKQREAEEAKAAAKRKKRRRQKGKGREITTEAGPTKAAMSSSRPNAVSHTPNATSQDRKGTPELETAMSSVTIAPGRDERLDTIDKTSTTRISTAIPSASTRKDSKDVSKPTYAAAAKSKQTR